MTKKDSRPHPTLTSAGEAQLFWHLRKRLIVGLVRQLLSTSRLRMLVIVGLSCVFWIGMFWVFYEGFRLLDGAIPHPVMRAKTIHIVYNLFFVSLLAMLSVSSGVILYGTLYDSEEVTFLLTTPTRAERIVLHKFQETLLFSGWGFILLGSPLLLAYGVEAGAPWYYYALLPPFMISFVCIPAGIGAVACLLVVYCLPSIRLHVAIAVCVLGVIVLSVTGWSLLAADQNNIMTPLWFQDVLGRLRYAEQRLLPSWWLSSGLLEAAHPAPPEEGLQSWPESLGFLCVLVSHALLVPVVVAWVGGKLLRPGYSRLHGLGRANRRMGASWIDQLALAVTWPLPVPMRLLLLKDVRLFRRDPLRWTQFLIFFGLLALYFVNIRRFQYGVPLDTWMTVIGFLNLGVVGLIHSTFTTRFIFPMISMEGRRFWILGTLPISRDLILWSKLLFAFAVSVVPCATLILLSDIMLRIVDRTPLMAAVHQLVCWVMCMGLSALAVGLGAQLPNLHEPSPSKIAAGFGGTLNLVLSAVFIIAAVLSTAVPSYFWLHTQRAGAPHTHSWWTLGTTSALLIGIAVTLLLACCATIVPLWIGFRAFHRLEC